MLYSALVTTAIFVPETITRPAFKLYRYIPVLYYGHKGAKQKVSVW